MNVVAFWLCDAFEYFFANGGNLSHFGNNYNSIGHGFIFFNKLSCKERLIIKHLIKYK